MIMLSIHKEPTLLTGKIVVYFYYANGNERKDLFRTGRQRQIL